MKLRSPYQLMQFMSDINYADFTTLKSPQEVIDTLSGSCHDQVLFELDALASMGLAPKAKFLMAVDLDDIGGETHSFVYYPSGNSVIWFENAWEDYQGLREFKTEQDLFDYVIDAFTDRNPGQYIYMGDFIPDEHTIGENLSTLVDICMENATQV